MSLFENDTYQWRETYFILFAEPHRPLAKDVERALKRLDPRYVIRDLRVDEQGRFESLTLESPDDYAGMDISLVQGDEVIEQTQGLVKDLRKATSTAEERRQLQQLLTLRCRFDVYHFEQLVFVGRDDDDPDDDNFLDPGALLMVMERLAGLCQGTIIDPQANAIL